MFFVSTMHFQLNSNYILKKTIVLLPMFWELKKYRFTKR